MARSTRNHRRAAGVGRRWLHGQSLAAAELVDFLSTGSGGETIAHFAGNDAPAILLVFFKGLAELVELTKAESQ
jgi:hypothetical protein